MVYEILLSYSRTDQILALYTLLISLIGFILMGIDKYRAKKEQWRIREASLFLVAFLGGSVGVLLGMVIFKHKTNHIKFSIGIPALYALNILMKILARYYLLIK